MSRSPVFIPLNDANPLKHVRRPYVTWGLALASVLGFVAAKGPVLLGAGEPALAVSFGVIPAVLDGGRAVVSSDLILSAPLTLLTYSFVHVDLLHLVGNMLFLIVFGDNVEDAFGHLRFGLFYFLAAAFAGLAHTVAHPLSVAPLVGASGAVAAVVAAYVMLHPRVQLWVLALGRVPLRLPAWSALGMWIAFQVYNVWVQPDDDVAWWAHLGGLASGFLLVLVFRRPGVSLFDGDVGLIIEEPSGFRTDQSN